MTFHKTILELGYDLNRFNHYVYIRKEDDKITILSLYADDILLVRNHLEMINRTKSYLISHFEIKDIGGASYYPVLRCLGLGLRDVMIRSRKAS